jgi:7-keto-8-aminopelargonate synthetase-like enzyme
LPPAIAAAAQRALAIVRGAEGDELRARVRRLAARVRDDVRGLGFEVRGDDGPIVPIVLGSEGAALAAARALAERGVYAPAIRPPTVPAGTSRLRISLRADHTAAELDRLLGALRDVAPVAAH